MAVYIAWQRWQTNRQKLRLHLYDRQLDVYEEVKNILHLATRDSNLRYADLSRFWLSASKADFLFGREIPAYIDEIHRHGVKIHYWNSARNYTTKKDNYNQTAVVDEIEAECRWFSEQFDIAKEKFHKYLV